MRRSSRRQHGGRGVQRGGRRAAARGEGRGAASAGAGRGPFFISFVYTFFIPFVCSSILFLSSFLLFAHLFFRSAKDANAHHVAAEGALAEAAEEAARVSAALAACRADAAALRTQVAAARTPPPPASPSPVDVNESAAEAATGASREASQVAELTERVARLGAERAQLLEKLHAIVGRFRAQQEQLAESKVRLAQAESDREALASTRAELAAARSAVAPAAAPAAPRNGDERVATLENEKAQLVAKMKEVLARYRQLQEERRKEKEVTAVQIKTVTDQVRRELQGIEAARDSSSSEAGRLRQQLDLLGARCMALESEVDAERKAHAPLRATVEQLRTEHAAALNEAADASSVAQVRSSFLLLNIFYSIAHYSLLTNYSSPLPPPSRSAACPRTGKKCSSRRCSRCK